MATIDVVQRLLGLVGFRLIKTDTYAELNAYRHCRSHGPDLLGLVLHTLDRPTFVQIGANDGIRDDEFRRHVGKFARGLMIEPQPAAYARLAATYEGNPTIKTMRCAVAQRSGVMTMHAFKEATENNAQLDVFSSFDLALVQKVKADYGFKSPIESFEVPALTLGDALTEAGLERVDVMVIDVEGFDFEIVKMIDFDAMRPRVIQFEFINLDGPQLRDALRYISEKGYSVSLLRSEVIAVLP